MEEPAEKGWQGALQAVGSTNIYSFLFLSAIPLYGYTTGCFSIHLLRDTFDYARKAAVDVFIQVFVWTHIFISLL